MNIYDAENKKRVAITVIASIVFVLAASLAFIGGISTTYLGQLKASADSAMAYGYDTYYINDEKVNARDFYLGLDDYYYNQSLEEGPYSEEYYDSQNIEESASYDDQNVEESEYYGSQSDDTIALNNVDENVPGFRVEHIAPDFKFNEDLFNSHMGSLWLLVIICGLLMLISIILIVRFCGTKNESGEISLSFFDRIFPEVQIAFGLLVALGLIGVYILLDHWYVTSDRIRSLVSNLFYDYHDLENLLSWYTIDSRYSTYYENILKPSWVVLLLIIVAAIVIFSILITLFISIIKKSRPVNC